MNIWSSVLFTPYEDRMYYGGGGDKNYGEL